MSRHVCDVMCWVKRSELSCGRTVLQYCCCLIAILTAWKQFLKISHREGSTRVRNYRDVMCLPAHDVTVIIFATFKMCHEHFHSTKQLHSDYLSQILWYKRYLFFCCQRSIDWERVHTHLDWLQSRLDRSQLYVI